MIFQIKSFLLLFPIYGKKGPVKKNPPLPYSNNLDAKTTLLPSITNTKIPSRDDTTKGYASKDMDKMAPCSWGAIGVSPLLP